MRLLVTGADGFVGRHLLRRLRGEGWAVVACHGAAAGPPAWAAEAGDVAWRRLDLRDDASVAAAAATGPDAVLHLAALASGREARERPGDAWEVNAAGTARLAEALGARRRGGEGDPLLLLASTGEVYGHGGPAPRRETDPPAPVSPYAASKLGAEIAAQEVARRTGLRVIIARPFAHTGPGQAPIYVAPAFAERLRLARRTGAPAVNVGNLEPVRDFLDVRDVVAAYLALLGRGTPGQVYNVASGQGIALAELFRRLAALAGARAVPETDAALARSADVAHLVGDATLLRQATGWSPAIPLDQTLQDLLDAQAD